MTMNNTAKGDEKAEFICFFHQVTLLNSEEEARTYKSLVEKKFFVLNLDLVI